MNRKVGESLVLPIMHHKKNAYNQLIPLRIKFSHIPNNLAFCSYQDSSPGQPQWSRLGSIHPAFTLYHLFTRNESYWYDCTNNLFLRISKNVLVIFTQSPNYFGLRHQQQSWLARVRNTFIECIHIYKYLQPQGGQKTVRGKEMESLTTHQKKHGAGDAQKR